MSEHTPLTEAFGSKLYEWLAEFGVDDASARARQVAESFVRDGWNLAARTSTATADRCVWKRNDQADHDAGHPSGYDCDGDALSGSEACGHRYVTTTDTGARE